MEKELDDAINATVQSLQYLSRTFPQSANTLYGALGIFRKSGFLTEVKFEPDGFKKLSVAEGTRIGSVVFHELIHWWQHCGTPYGLYCSRAQELQTQAIRLVCHVLAKGNKSKDIKKVSAFHRPFLYWLLNKWPGDDKRACFNAVRTFLAVENIQNALEGIGLLDEYTIAEAYLICDQLANREFESLSQLIFAKGNPVNSWHILQDDIIPQINNRLFGARQILETAARINELGGISGYDSIDENLLIGDYGAAYWIIKNKYPNKNIKEISLTTLALCDLALWSEIDPSLRKGPIDTMNWKDIHPGWRFLRSVDCLPKIGWITNSEDYYDFISEICKTYGWLTIEEILKIASRISMPSNNPILNSFKNCCALREEIPWAFAFTVYEPAFSLAYKKCLPPILFWKNYNKQVINHDDAIRLINVHDISTLIKQFSLTSDFNFELLISPKVITFKSQSEIQEYFSELIEDTFFIDQSRILS